MFRFRFESVLILRKRKEENAKLAYANRIREREFEEGQLKILESELQARYEDRTDLKDYFFTEQRIVFLKNAIKNQLERVNHKKKQVTQALQYFLTCKQGADVIEKLREKDQKKFEMEMRKKEQKDLDFIYTAVMNRREE